MDTVIQFLKDHLITPIFDLLTPMLSHWETLSSNPRVLAAVALLLGAFLIVVGARLPAQRRLTRLPPVWRRRG